MKNHIYIALTLMVFLPLSMFTQTKCDTLGAILAPVFGIMIVDYYIIKKEKLDVDDLFDDSASAKYHYNGGFNRKAILAWILSGYIAVGTVGQTSWF